MCRTKAMRESFLCLLAHCLWCFFFFLFCCPLWLLFYFYLCHSNMATIVGWNVPCFVYQYNSWITNKRKKTFRTVFVPPPTQYAVKPFIRHMSTNHTHNKCAIFLLSVVAQQTVHIWYIWFNSFCIYNKQKEREREKFLLIESMH